MPSGEILCFNPPQGILPHTSADNASDNVVIGRFQSPSGDSSSHVSSNWLGPYSLVCFNPPQGILPHTSIWTGATLMGMKPCFNPPQGILPHTSIWTGATLMGMKPCFNPPQGILPHTSPTPGFCYTSYPLGFNPPQGILPHTSLGLANTGSAKAAGFNPPQGILPHTSNSAGELIGKQYRFQSPSGDSSSHVSTPPSTVTSPYPWVSIPLRGFFLTRPVAIMTAVSGWSTFQSPSGDSSSHVAWWLWFFGRVKRFQSPSGDSSSHVQRAWDTWRPGRMGFNPPQGILPHTSGWLSIEDPTELVFQSPSGDSSSHVPILPYS